MVVGVALGLRLVSATIERPRSAWKAEAVFFVPRARKASYAITLAAGIAWERAMHSRGSAGDASLLRREGYSRTEQRALIRAAEAILATRGTAHARVTRALLDDDLRPADVAAIARGSR